MDASRRHERFPHVGPHTRQALFEPELDVLVAKLTVARLQKADVDPGMAVGSGDFLAVDNKLGRRGVDKTGGRRQPLPPRRKDTMRDDLPEERRRSMHGRSMHGGVRGEGESTASASLLVHCKAGRAPLTSAT